MNLPRVPNKTKFMPFITESPENQEIKKKIILKKRKSVALIKVKQMMGSKSQEDEQNSDVQNIIRIRK